MIKYLSTEYARIPYFSGWWTFGWGLLRPSKLNALLKALADDQAQVLHRRHYASCNKEANKRLTEANDNLKQVNDKLHVDYKLLQSDAEDLKTAYARLEQEVYEKTLLEHHKHAALLYLHAELSKQLAKLKKGDKSKKWISDLAKEIDNILSLSADDIRKDLNDVSTNE